MNYYSNFRVHFLLVLAAIVYFFLLFFRTLYGHVDWIDPSAGIEMEAQRIENDLNSSDLEKLEKEVSRELMKQEINDSLDDIYTETKKLYDSLENNN